MKSNKKRLNKVITGIKTQIKENMITKLNIKLNYAKNGLVKKKDAHMEIKYCNL